MNVVLDVHKITQSSPTGCASLGIPVGSHIQAWQLAQDSHTVKKKKGFFLNSTSTLDMGKVHVGNSHLAKLRGENVSKEKLLRHEAELYWFV